MVLGLAEIMERTINLNIFSHNLWILEQCKKQRLFFWQINHSQVDTKLTV